MKRTIYHDSNHIIQKPLYGGRKRYNDYDTGFYCTDSLEMAKEWGVAGISTVLPIAMYHVFMCFEVIGTGAVGPKSRINLEEETLRHAYAFA